MCPTVYAFLCWGEGVVLELTVKKICSIYVYILMG